MPPKTAVELPLPVPTFDGPLGRQIIETHIWAVRQGLRGATGHDLFDGFCQRLVLNGMSLWRAHAAMETLHPQWDGYGYVWRRDLNAIHPEHYGRLGDDSEWLASPLYHLVCRARAGEDDPWMRRRFEAGADLDEFAAFRNFVADGATDYFAQLFAFGEDGNRSHGSGIVYSFMTDRAGGFSNEEETVLRATLPALSLAMKADAGHVIASGLLGTYLGEDAGGRVHAGAVQRGSVSSLRAVLWYADIRGFTAMSDTASGPVMVELLNDVFETITSALRSRGGQVLKFIGDGMLATFAFNEAEASDACHRALNAAAEATRELAALDTRRSATGAPAVSVDIALHVGEVLYGNVGAADRLDFTVIGPAVNEVARIEALCEPLHRSILASAEFVGAIATSESRLISLGRHPLRGVKQEKEIFGLQ